MNVSSFLSFFLRGELDLKTVSEKTTSLTSLVGGEDLGSERNSLAAPPDTTVWGLPNISFIQQTGSSLVPN